MQVDIDTRLVINVAHVLNCKLFIISNLPQSTMDNLFNKIVDQRFSTICN